MRHGPRRLRPNLEALESRDVPTLVFVLNGNGFGAAGSDPLTKFSAGQLKQFGLTPVQIAYPSMGSTGAIEGLARKMERISHGQPIGIEGFSAGGSLAARLAQIPSLHVKAALDFYGPPDLRDWLTEHKGDSAYQWVTNQTRFSPGAIRMLSGPSSTDAYVVAAFGEADPITVAPESTVSFQRDFRFGQIFYYPGAHGVSASNSPEALATFVQHL